MIGILGGVILVLVLGVVLWNIAKHVYQPKQDVSGPILSSLPPLPHIVLPPVSVPSSAPPHLAGKNPSKSAVASPKSAMEKQPSSPTRIKKTEEKKLDMRSIPMFTQRKDLMVD